MPAAITTTELVAFLLKVKKISCHTFFTKQDKGYAITVNADWDKNSRYFPQTLVFTEEGLCHPSSSMEFHTLNDLLDRLVEKAMRPQEDK